MLKFNGTAQQLNKGFVKRKPRNSQGHPKNKAGISNEQYFYLVHLPTSMVEIHRNFERESDAFAFITKHKLTGYATLRGKEITANSDLWDVSGDFEIVLPKGNK